MSVAFNPVQGLIIAPAIVSGPMGDVALRLALDTGATETVISRSVLVRAGYRLSAASTVPMIMGGGMVPVPLILMDKLEALGQIQTGLTIQAHTLPPSLAIDGILGLDFIRRGRLVVRLSHGANQPHMRDTGNKD